MNLEELRTRVREFVRERDWEQYHDPKNLATGLSVEAAELLEIFLWTSTEKSHRHGEEQKERIGEELADVLIYAIMLSDTLGINLVEAGLRKLRINGEKYPVSLARGKSEKYDRLK